LGYAVAAYPKAVDGTELVNQIEKILAEDVKGGLPTDLIEAAKLHEVVDAEFQKNSVSGPAMTWSQAVAVEGRKSPEDDVLAIEEASVADVNRVARQYLMFDRAVTAVLKPQPSGKPVSSSSFGGRESLAPTATHVVAFPAWVAKALGRLSVPESSLRPVVTQLANGLKLIVQPESVSNTISIRGRIKDNPDLETPKGKEGVHSLLNQLFEYGTKTFDRLSFQRALDEIGANESAGVSFSLQVLPSGLDRGVQLLASNELNPALPESAFKTVQKRLSAAVAGELESPDFQMHRALDAALFPKDDPTLRHACQRVVVVIARCRGLLPACLPA
jgi:zinc protease